MKTIVSASIATLLFVGAAAAQGAAEFTTKNVSFTRPFGAINTYNVGVGASRVAAWAKGLGADERREMVGRCSVVIKNQQIYYAETVLFCQNFAIAIAVAESAGAAK